MKTLTLFQLAVVSFIIAFTGCSKKIQKANPVMSSLLSELENESIIPKTVGDREDLPGGLDRLPPIYFEFDKYNLTAEALYQLEKIGTQLKRKQSLTVQIEGHCDNRGTEDYNLALGERRAWEIREWLSRYGIEDSRISIISYGEEKAIESQCFDENCHSKNRRGDWNLMTIVQRQKS